MKARALKGIRACFLLSVAVLATGSARASHVVSFFGIGTVTANAWCSIGVMTPPPPAPNFTLTGGGFPDESTVLIGPGLGGGCNPRTQAGGENHILWGMKTLSVAGPPLTGAFEIASDDATELLPLLTPATVTSTANLSIDGIVLDSHDAEFTVTWSGDTSGTGILVKWFEGTTELDSVVRIGPGSDTFTQLITSVGDIQNITVEGDTAAETTSVPEPASIALIGIGIAIAGWKLRSLPASPPAGRAAWTD